MSTPLYRRIAAELRDAISRGELPPGSMRLVSAGSIDVGVCARSGSANAMVTMGTIVIRARLSIIIVRPNIIPPCIGRDMAMPIL